MSSEINSTHPFYPILIPNNLYVRRKKNTSQGYNGVPKIDFLFNYIQKNVNELFLKSFFYKTKKF